MAKYDVTLDDGRTIRIDVDDNVTPEEASRQAIALAPPLDSTPQQTVTAAPQSPSFGTQVLRGGEALAEGVIDSLAGAAGALPQLTAYAGRQIPVVRDYMPGPGYYPRKIKEAVKGAGEFLAAPVNRALGYQDSEGEPTGTYGPSARTPMESALSSTGRGVGAAMPFVGAANALNLTSKAGSMAQHIGKTMAAQPGIQLAAGGVGGLAEHVTGSPWAGLFAALGTGVGLSTMVNKLAQHGATTAAEKKIVNLIRELGDGDEAAGFAEVQRRLAAGGDDTALVDTLGIQGEKMARAAANVPEGQGPVIADEFVQTRVGGRGGRLQKAADTLAPNEFNELLETLSAKMSKDAKPLYDEAFAPVSDLEGKVFAQWDDRLQRFLDEPEIQQGMATGIKIQRKESVARDLPFNFKEFAVKGFDENGNLIISGTPNLRAMDAAKRGLDQTINAAKDDFGNIKWTPDLKATEELRKALVAKLDDITTDQSGRSVYKEARAAYAGPASLDDAARMGRKFIQGDEEVSAKAVAAMSEGEREAFRVGSRRQISQIINDDTQTALTKFAPKKVTFWNKLRTVFPDDESFNIFAADVEKELTKGRVENTVGPRAGPHSTPLKEDIAQLTRMPETSSRGLEAAGQFIAAPWNIVRPAAILARPAIEWVKKPSSKTAEGLAKYLFELSPAKQKTMLDALQGASTTKAHNLDMVKALMGSITAEQTPYETQDLRERIPNEMVNF
tara:strand:+ start:1707 stop:3893 length:2187 start_codon:yes stop_codon:yes gene_type:complete